MGLTSFLYLEVQRNPLELGVGVWIAVLNQLVLIVLKGYIPSTQVGVGQQMLSSTAIKKIWKTLPILVSLGSTVENTPSLWIIKIRYTVVL